MASADLHLGMGVDTRDFAAFARALRRAEPVLATQLQVQLRAAGSVVADEARSNAGDVSSSIPPSIKVRVSGATISVVAGGTGVPLAGLFELGNVSGGGGGSFRHPVFGNSNVWVDQPMHPFLAPAVQSKLDAVEQAAVNALDAAVAEVVR